MTAAASRLDPNMEPGLSPRELMAKKITAFMTIPARGSAEPVVWCREQQQLANLIWHVKMRDTLIRAGRIMLSNGRAERSVWDLR